MRILDDPSNPEWDRLVQESSAYDAYHRAGYHRLAQWNDEGRPLLFVHEHDDGRFLLPLLLREIPDGGGIDATSVYGYAGPLSTGESPVDAVAGFRRELSESLAELGVVSVFSRLNPHIDHSAIEGLGEVRRISDTVALDLTIDSEQAVMSYRKSHRRNLKRSAKAGLRCIVDEDFSHLAELSSIYCETMDRTDAGPSLRFNRAYFERLCAEIPDSAVHFICLDATDEIVGASIYLRGGASFNAHLGGSRSGLGLVSPATMETDTARSWGASEGLRQLNLGGGVGGDEDSLLRFKLGFSDKLCPFSVWRWIVDPVRYAELADGAESSNSFFPAYRLPNSATSKIRPGLEYRIDPPPNLERQDE